MSGGPEAAIVVAATWVAAATAGYLTCLFVRAQRAASAVALAVVALGGTAGGVASAGSTHPRPPKGLSLDWATIRHDRSQDAVIVRPGDSLWAITARELRDPSTPLVAARWPGWWRANRVVIGADPNLIHPGQRLRRPEPLPRRH